jgi:hypothetical protein
LKNSVLIVRQTVDHPLRAARQRTFDSQGYHGQTIPRTRAQYRGPNAIMNITGCAKFYSRSHDAVIRIYNVAGNVIETHKHEGDFKEW